MHIAFDIPQYVVDAVIILIASGITYLFTGVMVFCFFFPVAYGIDENVREKIASEWKESPLFFMKNILYSVGACALKWPHILYLVLKIIHKYGFGKTKEKTNDSDE